MFKVKYKKSRIRFHLIFGLVWLLLVISNFVFLETPKVFFYFYALLSVYYLIQYFYEKTKAYVEINDEFLVTNAFFRSQQIPVHEITQIRNSFGDFVISGETLKLHIYRDSMDKEAFVQLQNELAKIKPIT